MVAPRQIAQFYVYIVSNKAHTLYVGMTGNLIKRSREHRERVFQSGFTARYTHDRLVYFEIVAGYEAAMDREKQLKGWKRSRKVALIQSMNPNWLDLSLDWGEALELK